MNDRAAATRSASARARRASSGSRRTSAAGRSRFTVTTPTRSGSRRPACRSSAIAARVASACPASSICSTRTSYTTAARRRRDGFGYRIAYVEPAVVQAALGGRPLPFAAEPVRDACPATAGLVGLLADIDEPLDELAAVAAAAAVADALEAAAGRTQAGGAIDTAGLTAVREHLSAHPTAKTRAADLERIAGIDRWSVARQFRKAFGTSPDRYRRMRRLAVARDAIAAGGALARVAAETGFADQSHMTRHFTRTYGLTPGRWAALTAASR